MATRTFVGTNPKRKQIWKGSITTTTLAHTYILTFTNLDDNSTQVFTYAITASDTTTTIAATNFAAQFALDERYLLNRLSITTSANEITLTAKVAGEPFSVAESGTGTWGTPGVTQTNSSPEDVNSAYNYAEGVVPGNNDTVIFPAGNSSARHNLYALNAVTGATLRTMPGWRGSIGRIDGAKLYPLVLGITTCEIAGDGSLVALNFGSSTVSPNIRHTGAGDGTRPCVILAGTDMQTVNVDSGYTGIAAWFGQSATVDVAINVAAGAVLFVGTGADLLAASGQPAVEINNYGNAQVYCDVDTVNNSGFGVYRQQEGDADVINAKGRSEAHLNSGGTFENVNASSEARVRADEDRRNITIVNSTQSWRASLPLGPHVTYTNPTSKDDPIGDTLTQPDVGSGT